MRPMFVLALAVLMLVLLAILGLAAEPLPFTKLSDLNQYPGQAIPVDVGCGNPEAAFLGEFQTPVAEYNIILYSPNPGAGPAVFVRFVLIRKGASPYIWAGEVLAVETEGKFLVTESGSLDEFAAKHPDPCFFLRAPWKTAAI